MKGLSMKDLFPAAEFEPTLAAAMARIAAVRPGDYARTRNHLDGAVTQLSPYITHGFVSLPQVLVGVRNKYAIDAEHKFVFELGWREFFAHVWQTRGDGIFESLHEGVLPEAAYARELPADIRHGATGVPVVDCAVRQLYATGYLHNHVRMWLASYVVHLRKVHWRAGADWLYAHLLDGDLASNHLSWQWIAATGSHKPYLFNAANVERYAPPAWHSKGSVIDTDYETLDAFARNAQAVHLPCKHAESIAEPECHSTPPPELALNWVSESKLPAHPWLIHPWALRAPPPGRIAVGVFVAAFHARWPWSLARWQFVAQRMAALCDSCVWLEGPLPKGTAAIDDLHLRPHWQLPEPTPVPQLFAQPDRACDSFTQFYKRVSGSLQV